MKEAFISLSLIAIAMVPFIYYTRIKQTKLKTLSLTYYFACPLACFIFSFILGWVHTFPVSLSIVIIVFLIGFLEKKNTHIPHLEFKNFIEFITLSHFISPILLCPIILIMSFWDGSNNDLLMTAFIVFLLMFGQLQVALVFRIGFLIFSKVKVYKSTEPDLKTPVTSE